LLHVSTFFFPTRRSSDLGKQLLPIFPDFQDAGLPPMDDDYHPADLDDDGFDPMDGMGIIEPGEYEIYSMEGAHIVFDLPSDPSRDRKSTRLNSSHVSSSY